MFNQANNHDHGQKCVAFKQHASNKTRISLSQRSVKTSVIKAGDYVRIRLPTREHKLSPVYSEPRLVARANDTTVWLANGQRWNRRRCLIHRPLLKSQSKNIEEQHQGEHCDFYESDDIDTTQFTFPAGPQLRRSTRQRRARDFGPFIRY